jgi:hypothetical protein
MMKAQELTDTQADAAIMPMYRHDVIGVRRRCSYTSRRAQ